MHREKARPGRRRPVVAQCASERKGPAAVRAHPRLNRQLTVVAFALSAVSTVVVLLLIASLEPFERHENAPSVWWSILLWAMVGIGTWVVLLRLIILLLVPIAGIIYRKSGEETAPGPAASGNSAEADGGSEGEVPAGAEEGAPPGSL